MARAVARRRTLVGFLLTLGLVGAGCSSSPEADLNELAGRAVASPVGCSPIEVFEDDGVVRSVNCNYEGDLWYTLGTIDALRKQTAEDLSLCSRPVELRDEAKRQPTLIGDGWWLFPAGSGFYDPDKVGDSYEVLAASLGGRIANLYDVCELAGWGEPPTSAG